MGEVLGSRFNLGVSSLYDMRSSEERVSIFTTKGKTIGFEHINWSYLVYIMASCPSITLFVINLIP